MECFVLDFMYKDKCVVYVLAITYKENGVVCVRKVARARHN